MRILLINTVETGKNGITNVIFNYYQSINKTSLTFDYVSINKPADYFGDLISRGGGEMFILPRSFKSFFSYFLKLIQIIKCKKYDAVHIHTNSHTSVLELIAAFLGGCKTRIVHAHSTQCGYISIHKLLSPIFNNLYTNGIACSEKAGKFMFGDRFFIVMNNCIDTDKYAFNIDYRNEIRKQLDIQDDVVLIGHVGYFLELKNQRFIIEIMHKLRLDFPQKQYKLILIGDGPLRKTVESKASEYNLQNDVFFTGNIDNVSNYLNAIDLIVMPSLYEGLPLTLVEQQANGLHCIVSDTITKESDKTGNLVFLSLNDNINNWCKEIIEVPLLKDRKITSEEAIINIKKAGYSIQEEAIKLEYYYKSLEQKAK